MPERHRHHDSTERRKLFTIALESCSRSGGIRVHDALETVITMSRNMQLRSRVRADVRGVREIGLIWPKRRFVLARVRLATDYFASAILWPD